MPPEPDQTDQATFQSPNKPGRFSSLKRRINWKTAPFLVYVAAVAIVGSIVLTFSFAASPNQDSTSPNTAKIKELRPIPQDKEKNLCAEPKDKQHVGCMT